MLMRHANHLGYIYFPVLTKAFVDKFSYFYRQVNFNVMLIGKANEKFAGTAMGKDCDKKDRKFVIYGRNVMF